MRKSESQHTNTVTRCNFFFLDGKIKSQCNIVKITENTLLLEICSQLPVKRIIEYEISHKD